MKLSPKDNLPVEDMNKEIRESMQQAQALFYILQLHSDDRLVNDPDLTEKSSLNLEKYSSNTDNSKSNSQTDLRDANMTGLNMKSSALLSVDNNNNNLSNNSGGGISVGSGISKEEKLISIRSNTSLEHASIDIESYRKPNMQTAL